MCLGAIGAIEATWSEGGVPMASVAGRPTCLLYTPEAGVGDTILVHLGFAVEILDPDRAADAVALRTLGRERSTP
jgi:hydrogenase expression/formation protein HypC